MSTVYAKIPPPPPKGYTHLTDGATGEPVKVAPPGKCGPSCKTCWPTLR